MKTHCDIVGELSRSVKDILLAWKRFHKKHDLLFSDFEWLLESIYRSYEGFEDLRDTLSELSQMCDNNTEAVSISGRSNNQKLMKD
jgi:hypothetical protein